MSFLENIRHFFIPQTSNNHKSRALHPAALLLYITIFIFLQTIFQAIHIVKPNILGYATNITAEELYRLTNEKRSQYGLSSLRFSEKLSLAAKEKAIDMFNKNYWSHTSPDGLTPWQFILGSGYHYLIAGENLAKNFSDSQSVVEAWMNSQSHRANILKPDFQEIGFAIVDGKLQGEETTLVVQMFGTKKGTRIAQIQSQAAIAISISPPEREILSVGPTKIYRSTQISSSKLTEDVNMPIGFKSKIISYEIAGIKNKPLFDIRSLEKQLMIFMLLFLLTVLLIDGYFVYKHRTIRIAGRNWAHIIFILSILGIIYFAKAGAIL